MGLQLFVYPFIKLKLSNRFRCYQTVSSTKPSDIKIFAIDGLSLQQFRGEIDAFSLKLSKKGIRFSTEVINDAFVTIILYKVPSMWMTDEQGYFIQNEAHFRNPEIKIVLQFIWTCQYATINSILSGFHLSCLQIGLVPDSNKIVYTQAFASFVVSGISRSFRLHHVLMNEDNIFDILKYVERGVKYWWIPKMTNIEVLTKTLQHAIRCDKNPVFERKINGKSTNLIGTGFITNYAQNINKDYYHVCASFLREMEKKYL